MKLFTNIRAFLSARVHVWVALRPLPPALMAPTIVADAFPALAVNAQLGEGPLQTTQIALSEPAPPKPKRKRKAKVLQSRTLIAAPEPEPPPEDAWLTNLRNRKHHRIISNEAERLPSNTGSATINGKVIHRESGETQRDFITRVRGIVGREARIDWIEDAPDKTRLSIIQDHLNRPLRARLQWRSGGGLTVGQT